jgi:hypothetical protein
MGDNLLTPRKIDHLIISHYHDPEDGYAYLEDDDGWHSDGQGSLSSVVHRTGTRESLHPGVDFQVYSPLHSPPI